MHDANRARNEASRARLGVVKDTASREPLFSDPGLMIFVAGSMGREEMGSRSDFDPFIVSMKNFDTTEQEGLIAALNNLAAKLDFEPITAEFVRLLDIMHSFGCY